MVDSNDRERIGEARKELMGMLEEDELRDAVILVFANKQDLPNAMRPSEVIEALGLSRLTGRKWHVQGATATTGDGIIEGFMWLKESLFKVPIVFEEFIECRNNGLLQIKNEYYCIWLIMRHPGVLLYFLSTKQTTHTVNGTPLGHPL